MKRSTKFDRWTSSYDFVSFRRQEGVLVGLSIGLALSLLLAQVSWPEYLGQPHLQTLLLLSFGIVVNAGEYLWLRKRSSLKPDHAIRLTRLMIFINLGVAFVVAYFSYKQDVQYFALMLPAIIQAAFRFSLVQTTITVAISDALIFFWVWNYFRVHPPVDPNEYIEAGTFALFQSVTGILVWTLANQLRDKQFVLEQTLGELDKVEDKLRIEEKLAAVGRLSSAIAHEIRNPVTMITSALALAVSQEAGSQQSKEMYEIASKEAARLERLTTDFLIYARPRFPDRTETNLSDSIGYIAEVCRPRAAQSSIEILVDHEKELIAEVDAEQIQQAILNLLINAVEASTPQGVVLLRGKSEAGNIVIEIENSNGPIPLKVAECIFEPFFTTKSTGTGLGLAIARNIARAHGGDLTLAENSASAVRFAISIPQIALAKEKL